MTPLRSRSRLEARGVIAPGFVNVDQVVAGLDDPLILAFLDGATDVWPDLRVTPTHAAQ